MDSWSEHVVENILSPVPRTPEVSAAPSAGNSQHCACGKALEVREAQMLLHTCKALGHHHDPPDSSAGGAGGDTLSITWKEAHLGSQLGHGASESERHTAAQTYTDMSAWTQASSHPPCSPGPRATGSSTPNSSHPQVPWAGSLPRLWADPPVSCLSARSDLPCTTWVQALICIVNRMKEQVK